MKSEAFFRVLICSVAILNFHHRAVIAQNTPCTTPLRHSGTCVAIERCRNIYKIVNSPTPPPTSIANYIRQAACTLPNVERSVCCQPAEIVPKVATEPTPMEPRVSGDEWTHPKLHLLPTNCGMTASDRISGGNLTNLFDYPWMAVLRYETYGTIKDGCAGTLINKRYILTAAHCVRTRSTMRLHSVVLGEHTKNQDIDCNTYKDSKGKVLEETCADPVEVYGIESFVYHPDFNLPKYSNDIALIRLDNDVKMKDSIQPICLPVTSALQKLAIDTYIATGWGATEEQEGSDVLLQAKLPTVNIPECQQRMTAQDLNIRLNDKQMCAGGVDKVDTCNGDSGGPIGFTAPHYGTRFVQFGVVSLGGKSCGVKSVPGVYCRTATYMDWILDNMKA